MTRDPEALHITVSGAVQGVGFRPFVYRLARELGLAGSVENTAYGVLIVASGDAGALAQLRARLWSEAPSAAVIEHIDVEAAHAAPGSHGFHIAPSHADRAHVTLSVGPDLATCAACLSELFDGDDRRHRYPFINCTACGPRYTIVRTLPYDRAGTTMSTFALCALCSTEYEDPGHRRFHAQPNACPACGPTVSWLDGDGRSAAATPTVALAAAVRALTEGAIVAVMGVGGFHLMVRADSDAAVERLRERKARGPKPFAVMYRTLEQVERGLGPGALTQTERQLLEGAAAPIVLVRRARLPAMTPEAQQLAARVAPTSPDLGVMLASNPLHHLLLHDVGAPLVATSGNRAEEPIAITAEEAQRSLAQIADGFLVHDRPIGRPIDDSIAREALGQPMILRRARGFAPLMLDGDGLRQGAGTAQSPATDIAVGAHGKSTVALNVGGRALLSPHIGDLSTEAARLHHSSSLVDLQMLADVRAARVVCDRHPDYASTLAAEQLGETLGQPPVRVQHHVAHARAGAFELKLGADYAAFVWDGSGYGDDGTVWGGELLVARDDAVGRAACFEPFALPGGEHAVRQPWRCAVGLLAAAAEGAGELHAALKPLAPPAALRAAWSIAHGPHATRTSSVGRLFDAVAALLGLCREQAFESDAALRMEQAAEAHIASAEPYPVELTEPGAAPRQIPVASWLLPLLEDHRRGTPPGVIAARFHRTLARAAALAWSSLDTPEERVLLTGGCFQNRTLLECTVAALGAAGARAVWPQKVPVNDGGIALGQLCDAALR